MHSIKVYDSGENLINEGKLWWEIFYPYRLSEVTNGTVTTYTMNILATVTPNSIGYLNLAQSADRTNFFKFRKWLKANKVGAYKVTILSDKALPEKAEAYIGFENINDATLFKLWWM